MNNTNTIQIEITKINTNEINSQQIYPWDHQCIMSMKQWISCINRLRNRRWRTRGRNSVNGRVSTLTKNLIHRHMCRSQITSVNSETSLSLDLLHGGRMDDKAEKRRRRKWVYFHRVEWTERVLLYAWCLLYILKDSARLRFDLSKF
jgi:hypothetical protein